MTNYEKIKQRPLPEPPEKEYICSATHQPCSMCRQNCDKRKEVEEDGEVKVLVACEESQRVCTDFREKGHEAYFCDIIECSGGHPEWHIKQDVLPLLNGNCEFETEDGNKHQIKGKWDLIIAHPPCAWRDE